MPTVEFEGVSLDENNLVTIFRDAAHGSVPVHDVEASQNPGSWALALAHHVAASPLKGALPRAIESLLASGDAAEMELAVDVQQALVVLDGATLWPMFFKATGAGQMDEAKQVAVALLVVLGRNALHYDKRVRDLLVASGVPRDLFGELLSIASALDRPWVVQHPELFFGDSEDDVEMRISEAAPTSSAELEKFAHEIGDALAARGRPLPPSTLQTIKDMVASRQKAGL